MRDLVILLPKRLRSQKRNPSGVDYATMLLILCVDLDDDLGRKTGIKTPVIGRQAVESAALALAIADPTDSDGNVMFQGLQLYEKTLPDITARFTKSSTPPPYQSIGVFIYFLLLDGKSKLNARLSARAARNSKS